jgi:hypothetical protein
MIMMNPLYAYAHDGLKGMLSGIKSWHDNILACANNWIYKNISDKQGKLKENKIKEMPVGCLK